MSATQLLRK